MTLTKIEKRAVVLLSILLGLLGIAMIMIGIQTNNSYLKEINPYKLPVGADNTAIVNYKNITAAIKANQSYLNELLVVDFMRPLFNLLLPSLVGYFFGKPLIDALATRIKSPK
jgi:hypothetical protein